MSKREAKLTVDVDEKPDLMKSIERLVARSDALLANKLGSPRRGGKAEEKKAKTQRRRISEREEDQQLLAATEHDLEDDEGSGHFRRLTVQPSIITGGTMRDYQLEGLNWLISLYDKGLSGILADEMGLGKTLQTISLLAYLRQFRNVNGPHLVLVPLSTLPNWLKEFQRWCPSIRTLKLWGSKEERSSIVNEELMGDNFDVCVATYEMALKEQAKLKKVNFQYLVVDEAHRLKNENSKLSQVVRLFNVKYRLLLTGTPLQNNLHELWALLNFLLPETFESSEDFDAIFQLEEGTEVQSGVLSQLHKLLSPFVLRRLKSEVEKSLLPKVETIVHVGMSEMQKKVYRGVLMHDIDAVQGQCKERARLLNIVMQLRKAANHPYLFDGNEDLTLPPEDCEHLIFNSGKMFVLDKLLIKLKAAGSRVLIFTQMTRMVDILEDYCNYRGYGYCRIDGSTDNQTRDEQMTEFNKPDSDKFVFLLSTRAGGLGINLATADIVILYDSDWNPQMDLQAQDRAHRIGQKKQVRVYRLIVQDSIEEKIIERAQIKLRLDALVIQQGRLAQAQKKLTQADMQEMIRFGADKVFRSKDSTISDEDIDLILSKGQQKTAELNEKLQKNFGDLQSFSLSASSSKIAYTFDGIDYSESKDKAQSDLDFLAELHASIPKRDRKKAHQTYDVDAYYREAMTLPKQFRSLIPRPMKPPKMHDYQFFNQDRILELCTKEITFWETYRAHTDPPAQRGLTDEEVAERERLIKEGFGDWNKKHFYSFLRACETHGRANTDKISTSVKDKTAEEVLRYHTQFFKRYKEINGWERIIKAIERSEKSLQRRSGMLDALRVEMSKFGSWEDAYEQLSTELKYNPTNKGKGFTVLEDVFMLFYAWKHGYGEWNQVLNSFHKEDEFMFDYFIKSRAPADIHRRVDILIRMLEKKQSVDVEKKEGPKSKSPAQSPKAPQKDSKASASVSGKKRTMQQTKAKDSKPSKGKSPAPSPSKKKKKATPKKSGK